jgi:hypothetical protein
VAEDVDPRPLPCRKKIIHMRLARLTPFRFLVGIAAVLAVWLLWIEA